MIIGTILEMSNSGGGTQTDTTNGSAMFHFYSMADAITWAEMQSSSTVYGTSPWNVMTLCTVINTDTEVKRWWFNGIEYTG